MSVHGIDAEITPVTIAQKKGDPIVVTRDEHPRETSLGMGSRRGRASSAWPPRVWRRA